MAWVSYQRILDGTSVSGRFGESLQITERWQVRVDSPATSKVDILAGFCSASGVKYGSSHFEFSACKALEFELSPINGKSGMLWGVTVKYYIPEPKKTPQQNGIPKDVWDVSGDAVTIPAFRDASGTMITNSAFDPVEGLEKEREEWSWSLTKNYTTDAALSADIQAYAGRVNSAAWAGNPAKTWKCYFKGAKKVSIAKFDGQENGGQLEYVESHWEFKHDTDTWKSMPWDVGFMELVGGERKTITGQDGKAVKQPVALNSNGTKKAPGEAPSVIRNGDGADLYLTANFSAGFGTPSLVSQQS